MLVIDIGTTNIFALVYGSDGLINTKTIPIKTSANKTQDAHEILNHVSFCIDYFYKTKNIQKVVLSTPMHTLILLDHDFKPLSKMMLWHDNRSAHALDVLNEEVKNRIYKNTGTPLHSMSPFSKLFYLKPETPFISDLKSYLMVNLTDTFVTDYSNASSSGLWNLHTKTWDKEVLELLNLDSNQFPSLCDINTTFIYKNNPNIEIMIGATDGVLANRGIANNDEIVISIGTSMGIRTLSKKPYLNGGFCYYAGFDQWLIGHASNNGGNVLEWIKTQYEPNLSYKDITNIILDSSYDVFCVPYLFGERGPFWKDGLKADIPSHYTKKETINALVYGIFTNASLILKDLPIKTDFVYLTGGFFNNETLRSQFTSFIEKNSAYYTSDYAVSYGMLSLYNLTIQKTHLNYESYIYNPKLAKYKIKYENYLKKEVLNR